jgi:tetratricopeptide (TPR) repeat protein
MYLRTPKRYRPNRRRRQLRLFSGRTILMLLVIALVAAGGWYIWNHQGQIRSSVLPQLEDLAQNVQTQVAPRPTPTATPDLVVAQAGCTGAYQQGNIEEAIKQCSLLADNSPNDIDMHYQVTRLLIITSNSGHDTARIARALEYAEKTINADPLAPHGWAIRAMALDWSGSYGAALASALHARSLDSSFAPTYAFLGEIYSDLGQTDLAQSYLEQAIKLDTGGLAVADAFRNLGKLYSDQGLWEESIEPYQVALQQAPNDTYIAIELANNYIALEDVDTAIQVLLEAQERNPTNTAVLFALANAYVRNGAREQAFEYYSRCLDINPDNMLCLSYLGGLQWSDGDFVPAIANLQRAIDLGSQDPDDFLQLGRSHIALADCTQAIPYLQQGYQLVVNLEDYDRQARFINALQDCGVLVEQQVPDAESAAEPADTAEETPE